MTVDIKTKGGKRTSVNICMYILQWKHNSGGFMM